MAKLFTDYKFAQEVPKDLACSICLNVLQEPQMVNCCEKKFCMNCLLKWKESNESCALCRSDEFTHMHAKATSRQINNLKVYCPNSQNGCQATPAIKDCELHLSQDNPDGCLYIMLPCPNGCGEDMFRVGIDQHDTNDCPKRQEKCLHCGKSGWYVEMNKEHPQQCPLYPLHCPRECGATIARIDLPSHQTVCPMQQVECPFKDAGCSVNLLRQDEEEHLTTTMMQHLLHLTSFQKGLQKTITSLQNSFSKEYAKLQRQNDATDTKLSQVGTLLQGLTDHLKDSKIVSLRLKQLDTILKDTSIAAVDSSIILYLSKKIGQGLHFIIVNQTKFELEWKYQQNNLTLQLFIAENQPVSDRMCYEFIVLLEPQGGSDTPRSPMKAVSSKHTLATICSEKFQRNSKQDIPEPIGHGKTVYVNTDAKLVLMLRQPNCIYKHQTVKFKRSSCQLSLHTAESSGSHAPRSSSFSTKTDNNSLAIPLSTERIIS